MIDEWMTRSVEFLKRRFELLLFAVLSLFVVFWFIGGSAVHQIDALFYLNPERRLSDVLYFWKAGETLGLGMAEFNLVPFYFIQTVLVDTFTPIAGGWNALVISQLIITYCTTFLAFFFGHMFFKEFYGTLFGSYSTSKDRVIVLVVTIFYVINPFTLSIVFWRYMLWSIFWAAFPLLCFLFLRYLKTAKVRYILYSGLVFLTPLGSGFSQVTFITLAIAFIVLALMVYFRNPSQFISIGKNVVIYSILFILLTSWVIIPQFLSLASTSSFTQAPSSASDAQMLDYASQFTTLKNIFTFQGNYLLYSSSGNLPYSWTNGYFSNGAITAGLFIYPILFVIAILFLTREKDPTIKKTIIALSAIFLVLPLLMKGNAEPFSGLGTFLSNLQSNLFRHPYDRFIAAFILIYSLILLYVFRKFSLSKADAKRFFAIAIAFILVFTILNYPIVTGDSVPAADKINMSGTSYLDLQSEMKGKLSNDSRILVIPFSISGEYSYNISGNINHPNSKSLIYDYLPQSSVLQFSITGSDRSALEYLQQTIEAGDREAFIAFLNHLDVHYIALQKDYSNQYSINYYDTILPAEEAVSFTSEMIKDGSLRTVFENNDIAIYSIPETMVTPGLAQSPLLLLGGFYEIPGVPSDKPVVPLDTTTGDKYDQIASYPDIILGNRTDSWDYSLYLLSDKTVISPQDTGLFGPGEWTDGKILGQRALYTDRTRTIASNPPITDSDLMARWSFEDPSSLNEWSFPSDPGASHELSNLSVDGNHSLVLTTRGGETPSPTYGPIMSVQPESVLEFSTNVKIGNTNGTNVTVLGFNDLKNEWIPLVQVPSDQIGVADWSKYVENVQIPSYVSKIKLAINQGRVLDTRLNSASTWIDDIRIYNVTKYSYPMKDLVMDFSVPIAGNYHIVMNYLQGPEGGQMSVGMDGLTTEYQTKDAISKFIFADIGTYYLDGGQHKIYVKNIHGLNSIASFALISEQEFTGVRDNLTAALGEKSITHAFDASHSLYYVNATSVSIPSDGLLFGTNGSAWQSFDSLVAGDYELAIYGSGEFNVTLGSQSYVINSNGSSYEYTPIFHLDQGAVSFLVNATAGSFLKGVWVYHPSNGSSLDQVLGTDGTSGTLEDFTRVDPTHWRAHINSTGPTTLVLSESYDPQWEATVYKDGKVIERIKPVPLYGITNGFVINTTGELEIDVHYTPQQSFETSLIISVLTFIGLFAGVVFVNRNRFKTFIKSKRGKIS